jgi:hypothetical protein
MLSRSLKDFDNIPRKLSVTATSDRGLQSRGYLGAVSMVDAISFKLEVQMIAVCIEEILLNAKPVFSCLDRDVDQRDLNLLRGRDHCVRVFAKLWRGHRSDLQFNPLAVVLDELAYGLRGRALASLPVPGFGRIDLARQETPTTIDLAAEVMHTANWWRSVNFVLEVDAYNERTLELLNAAAAQKGGPLRNGKDDSA